jgi:hypothetical protein
MSQCPAARNYTHDDDDDDNQNEREIYLCDLN